MEKNAMWFVLSADRMSNSTWLHWDSSELHGSYEVRSSHSCVDNAWGSRMKWRGQRILAMGGGDKRKPGMSSHVTKGKAMVIRKTVGTLHRELVCDPLKRRHSGKVDAQRMETTWQAKRAS